MLKALLLHGKLNAFQSKTQQKDFYKTSYTE
jgi:hypothetical protein